MKSIFLTIKTETPKKDGEFNESKGGDNIELHLLESN